MTTRERKYRASQNPNLMITTKYVMANNTSTRRINPGAIANMHPAIPISTGTLPNCGAILIRALEMLPVPQLALDTPLKLSASISLLSAVKSLPEPKSVLKKGKRGFPNCNAFLIYHGDATVTVTAVKRATCRVAEPKLLVAARAAIKTHGSMQTTKCRLLYLVPSAIPTAPPEKSRSLMLRLRI